MAPAASKEAPKDEASDMVKSFRVAVKDGDGVGTIGTIRLDNVLARKLLAESVIKTLKGEGNKSLKRANACFAGAGIIQSKLLGKVDDHLVIPVVGRGKGRDTVDKDFYKGNGDLVLTPDMFVERDGMLVVSGIQHQEAVNLVQTYFLEKVGRMRRTNPNVDALLSVSNYSPPVQAVNVEVPPGKKAKTSDNHDGLKSSNVSVESPSDAKMPAMKLEIDDVAKAAMFDSVFQSNGVAMSVATKAKMYDEYILDSLSPEKKDG